MSTTTRLTSHQEIEYPESDGEPMAENTVQYGWITTIKGGLDIVFKQDPNVFVAGDLFWYPVEGDNRTRRAPDVMVAFGRPKGDRGAYLQWREGGDRAPGGLRDPLARQSRGGTGPQVPVLRDVRGRGILHLRPRRQHARRLAPRRRTRCGRSPTMNGWTSPRLGVRFELGDDQLRLYGPDGQPFFTMIELDRQAEEQRRRADEQTRQAEEQRRRADEQTRLAEQLKALGIEPEL